MRQTPLLEAANKLTTYWPQCFVGRVFWPSSWKHRSYSVRLHAGDDIYRLGDRVPADVVDQAEADVLSADAGDHAERRGEASDGVHPKWTGRGI